MLTAFLLANKIDLLMWENWYPDRKRDFSLRFISRYVRLICLDLSGLKERLPAYKGIPTIGPLFHNKPYPWDSMVRRPLAARAIDVGHVGAVYGKRAHDVNMLRDFGIHVACFGGHYFANEFRKGATEFTSETLPEDDYWATLFEIKVAINWGNIDEYIDDPYLYDSHKTVPKDRLFDSMCAGCLTLFDGSQETTRGLFTPGVHYVSFEDVSQVVNVLRRVKAEPDWAQTVADAGYLRAKDLQASGGVWKIVNSELIKKDLTALVAPARD